MKLQPVLYLILSAAVSFTACSSNRNDSDGIQADSLSHKLKSVSDPLEFERNFKDALIAYFNSRGYGYGPVFAEEDTAGSASSADSNGSADAGSSSTESVSGTNVQEEGVDEADRIKTNGESLFVLTSPNYYAQPVDVFEGDVASDSSMPGPDNQQNEINSVRLYGLDAGNADAQLISEFDLVLDPGMVADGMYLSAIAGAERLTITANGYGNYSPYWYEPYSWGGFQGALTQLDVSNTADVKQLGVVEFSGSIISTRRIGEHLIVASRFFPDIDGIIYFPQTDSERANNRSIIEAMSLDDLLPAYKRGDTRGLLTNPESCFVPESADTKGYNPDVISLVSYNLSDMSIADSVCFVGSTETFYASKRGMFLATTRYDWSIDDEGMADYSDSNVETDIHAFSFADGDFSYDASGVVKGHLGWNFDRRPFRLSEKAGDLRVVSFTGELEADKSPVRFTVLRNQDGDLKTLSTLPNDVRPEPLGKPGEQLYGSRFVGDRAFFVTFRATDPLYVLDISNPAEPYVAGELYIDGYSDYLHPVSDSLLLGLGKDAIPDTDFGDGRGAWYQGVKVSLVDISDPSSPTEVDKIVLGKRGTESPALWNHHAFTYLATREDRINPQLAVPLAVHETPSGYAGDSGKPWEWFQWTRSGLQLFEIDETSKTLIDIGFMEVANRKDSDVYYGVTADDRSVIADEAVYLMNNNRVYGAFWQTPEQWNGPR